VFRDEHTEQQRVNNVQRTNVRDTRWKISETTARKSSEGRRPNKNARVTRYSSNVRSECARVCVCVYTPRGHCSASHCIIKRDAFKYDIFLLERRIFHKHVWRAVNYYEKLFIYICTRCFGLYIRARAHTCRTHGVYY